MRNVLLACAVGAGVGAVAAPASAGAFEQYGLSYRAFSTPPVGGGSFGVAGAALADGRLVMVTGNSVFLESGVGTGAFDEVAVLDAGKTGGSTDPSFLVVSPSGSRIAVGAGFGKPVAVFDVSALGTKGSPTQLTSGVLADYFAVSHYDAAWYDDRELAISAGDLGSAAYVSMLDTASDTGSPLNEIVVSGISGSSAGVAFDGAGRLFTGNGFADGQGSDTGWIKAFAPAEWAVGADFEAGGTLVGDVLSAGSLEFDAFGNLAVGGGDFGEFDAGYFGVIASNAIANALAGHGPIDEGDPLQLKRLDPRGDGFGYFGAASNGVTGEFYVTDGTTWYATAPTPSGVMVLGAAGLMAWRRRR
ncbi:MAG: hypothetical protein IPJ41_16945 [Phycisphaerales bacterium]|nr:hypothetical protein [Phycisphaerales bacterium]